MQGAVAKRRTTLAIKKAEKAAGNGNPDSADPNEMGGMGHMTDMESAGPSDPTTPASMYGPPPPGPGPLAHPQGPPMMLQPAPPPQGFLQHPPYQQYGMPPGRMGPMP